MNSAALTRFKKAGLRVFILLLVGFALYISVKDVKLKEVGRAIRDFKLSCIFICLFLNILVIATKGLRLTFLLSGLKKGIPYREVLAVLVIAYFYNILFPARGGDLLGLLLLSRMKDMSKAKVLGVMLTDKLVDGLLLVIISLPLIYSVLPSQQVVRVISLILIVLLLFFLFLFFSRRQGGSLKRLGDGLQVIFKRKMALKAVLLTLLSWSLQISIVYCLLLDAGNLKTWWAGIWFLLAVNISIALVQAPGNIGSMEAGGTYSLIFLGYEKETALSFTLIYHFINLLPLLIAGPVLSFYMGFRLPFAEKSSQGSSS